MIKQEGIFQLTSETYVRHVDLLLANTQGAIFRLSVGVFVESLIKE